MGLCHQLVELALPLLHLGRNSEGPWEFGLHIGPSAFQKLLEIELLFPGADGNPSFGLRARWEPDGIWSLKDPGG